MKLKFYAILLTVFGFISGNAQDLHFTQYEFVPIHMNPANTGGFSGSYRLGALFRNQSSVGLVSSSAYRTPMAYADVTFPWALRKKDWTALGLNFSQDRHGEIGVGSTGFIASVAYHFGLSKNSDIAIGGQYGSMSYGIFDAQKAKFYSTLQGGAQDVDFSSLQGQSKSNISDLTIGVQLTTQVAGKSKLSAGIAASHLNKPVLKIFTAGGGGGFVYKLPMLLSVNASLNYPLNEKLDLIPMVYFRSLSDPKTFTTQCKASYLLNPEKSIRLNGGLGMRFGDAIQFLVGMDYGKIKAQLGYDQTIGGLKSARNSPAGVGAVELGIQYIGIVTKKPNPKPKVFCPRF